MMSSSPLFIGLLLLTVSSLAFQKGTSPSAQQFIVDLGERSNWDNHAFSYFFDTRAELDSVLPQTSSFYTFREWIAARVGEHCRTGTTVQVPIWKKISDPYLGNDDYECTGANHEVYYYGSQVVDELENTRCGFWSGRSVSIPINYQQGWDCQDIALYVDFECQAFEETGLISEKCPSPINVYDCDHQEARIIRNWVQVDGRGSGITSNEMALWFYRLDEDNWGPFSHYEEAAANYITWENHALFMSRGFDSDRIFTCAINSVDLPIVVNYEELSITLWATDLFD